MGNVIAIDGPAGAGKSTIARLLAEKLSYIYIDTGAMYRSVALWALRQGVRLDDPYRLQQLAIAAEFELPGPGKIKLNGEDVSEEIRTAEVSAAASKIAAVGGVRTALVAKQREIAERRNVVMEGRDIGSNVFPETPFKFYLDANLQERTKRRESEGVSENLAARDDRDSQRAAAPLMVALGAKVINNSNMGSEETSALIINDISERLREMEKNS